MHSEIADPLERMKKVHEATNLLEAIYGGDWGAEYDGGCLRSPPMPIIDRGVKIALKTKMADYAQSLDKRCRHQQCPRIPTAPLFLWRQAAQMF